MSNLIIVLNQSDFLLAVSKILSSRGSALILTNRCRHFVRYEGVMTVTGINVSALMMLIRYV